MSRSPSRPHSPYSRAAVTLLGQLIRRLRIERKLTAEALAERAGMSRSLLQRIEKGDPGCSIGAVFEAASIVGIKLFDANDDMLQLRAASNTTILTLLPKTVRSSRTVVKDDF